MNSRAAIAAVALSAILAAPAKAENATLVTLDSTELELLERSAAKTAVSFSVPLRTSHKDVTLRRWSISKNGRLIDQGSTKIELEKLPNGTDRLSASFDLTKLDAAGQYQVTIEFRAPKPPAKVEAKNNLPAAGSSSPAPATNPAA